MFYIMIYKVLFFQTTYTTTSPLFMCMCFCHVEVSSVVQRHDRAIIPSPLLDILSRFCTRYTDGASYLMSQCTNVWK